MFRFIMAVCLIFISCPSFSSIEINGTYKQYIEDGVYSTLVVERKDQSSVFISMNCQNGRPNFNSGMVKRTLLKLNNNTVRYNKARFDDEVCIIDIEFTENQAKVSQIAGYGVVCGFGIKVICDGVFTKT
ncbi:hypothetical protein ACHELS_004283 [Vibrio vulnificus]|uniref:hypothetical protein n=2 Tax=Vibrio vulnificus TaxID=672 RepID=UPI0012F9E4DE|nr:hypothetical protein [Vibrio vulnificus]EGQ8176542.1 hypothetical protein [Vibrio vulnificus]EGR0089209.1 hypothetical protein [Vibrio vulnificus]EHY0959276.1 hypothetical protein [Vibrio vulnificus]EIO4079380.1 hypothetical protein [Vibrio vulnificus]ELC9583773.1 hypothetical protein [Vibrio vulnificus]